MRHDYSEFNADKNDLFSGFHQVLQKSSFCSMWMIHCIVQFLMMSAALQYGPSASNHAKLNTDVSTFWNALDKMSNQEICIFKSLVQQIVHGNLGRGVLVFGGLISLLHKNGGHEKMTAVYSQHILRQRVWHVCNSGRKSCSSGALR